LSSCHRPIDRSAQSADTRCSGRGSLSIDANATCAVLTFMWCNALIALARSRLLLPGARARSASMGRNCTPWRFSSTSIAFGDSWFEGVGSTVGANNRSVDVLNRRLERGWVVNQGIAGNRLLRDEIGEHALARFDRDVLTIPAATHVLVHFGINDLGLPGMSGEPPATADALVAGFAELARRAHAANLRILAATIGPFAGAVYPGVSTPEGLAVRREVNDWIRTTDAVDAVFDVARAVEDPDAPDHIHPALDAGDGMHLNDEGAQAMAEAVDLDTLVLQRPPGRP